MTPRTNTELGRWVTMRRTSKNLSIRELGRQSGVTHTAIANAEKGLGLSVNACKKLARFFGVPQEFMLRMAGHLDKVTDPKGVLMNMIVEEATPLDTIDMEELIEFIRMKKSLRGKRQGQRRNGGEGIKTEPL